MRIKTSGWITDSVIISFQLFVCIKRYLEFLFLGGEGSFFPLQGKNAGICFLHCVFVF